MTRDDRPAGLVYGVFAGLAVWILVYHLIKVSI